MEITQRSHTVLWMIKRRTQLMLAGFVVVMLLVILWPRMVFVIESGHAGVVYRTFWGGTVTDTVRDEGLQIIMPWNTLTIYDVRLQQVEQQFSVISNDGLEVKVILSIRYSPKIELLGLLHRKIGPEYVSKIVIPDVHALIRTTFGQYSPEEIYRTKRSLIQETFQSALSNLGDKYVEMDDLLIKSIELPEMVKAAIENKHVEQQLMLQMRFRIDREKLEAQRKEIEASGVDRFQTIVSQSLTPELLQYKGIDALAKLAQSPNSKLVLAGGGSNGVPLILDTSTGAPWRDQAMMNLPGSTGGASSTQKGAVSLLDQETALDRQMTADSGSDNSQSAETQRPIHSPGFASPSPTPSALPDAGSSVNPTATPAPGASPSPTPGAAQGAKKDATKADDKAASSGLTAASGAMGFPSMPDSFSEASSPTPAEKKSRSIFPKSLFGNSSAEAAPAPSPAAP